MQKELLKAKSDLYEVNYKNKKLKEKLFESKKEIERLKEDVYHYQIEKGEQKAEEAQLVDDISQGLQDMLCNVIARLNGINMEKDSKNCVTNLLGSSIRQLCLDLRIPITFNYEIETKENNQIYANKSFQNQHHE